MIVAFCISLVSCGGGGSGGTVPQTGSNGGNASANPPVDVKPMILAGALSTFESPTFVAIDSLSNRYIADARNQVIYKSSTSGSLTVFAGKVGMAGYGDGQGDNVRFHDPYGVAVDITGNVYVSDLGNNVIRKITPGGVVSTLAGSGAVGANDGPGSVATFNHPTALAVDANGIVFVSDMGNNAIRRITPDGTVTTIALAAPLLFSPRGIATDSQGNIYVVNFNSEIEVVSPNGQFIAFYPAPTGVNCIGVAVSSAKDIYITCASGFYPAGKVYKHIANYEWQAVAGTDLSGYKNGVASGAQFGQLIGIAVDGNNDIYVADNGTASVRKLSSTGDVSLLAGSVYAKGYADGSGADARFNSLASITHDGSNNLYVADFYNNAVRKITSSGVVSTVRIGSNPPDPWSSLIGPIAVAEVNNCLVVMSLSGVDLQMGGTGYTDFSTIHLDNSNFGCPNILGAETRVPAQYMALNAQGILYYVETGQVIEDKGIGIGFGAIAGSSTMYAGNVPVFNRPSGLVVDSGGNIYLADMGDNVIYKISSKDHAVSLFAGTRLKQGIADGNRVDATFMEPYQLAIDGADNIYVVEKGPVRKITPAGIVSTLNLKWGTPALRGLTISNGTIYGVTTGAILQAPLP